MDYSTRSYTQETPAWLWDAFTDGGPAGRCDRYSDRITQLIAADVLANCPDQLDEGQRDLAEDLATEVNLDGV